MNCLKVSLVSFIRGGTTDNQNPKRPCMKLWQALYQKLIRSVLDKKEDQAPLAEIKALDQWCKERKGRGGDLCRELKVAHSFISQITNQTRPCSKERYEQIKLAMEAIEKWEQVA